MPDPRFPDNQSCEIYASTPTPWFCWVGPLGLDCRGARFNPAKLRRSGTSMSMAGSIPVGMAAGTTGSSGLPIDVKVSPDGRQVYVAESSGGYASIIDA